MKEWSNDCNAFNTWKILFIAEQLRQISEGNFPPPITVDTDTSNACNQKCIFCNSQVFRKKTKYCNMPKGHLLTLADFYNDWGVKSTCIGGGGEPLMNDELKQFIPRLARYGIESGVITNGVKLDNEYAYMIVDNCRFLGISCDAATVDTYKKMRGTRDLEKVLRNLEAVNNIKYVRGSKLDTNIKFLIHPYNYKEIYETAKIARSIGCSGIHIRPVAIDNVPGVENPHDQQDYFTMREYVNEINEQIEQTFTLETKEFRVFAVKHKFSSDLGKVVKFRKCRATPIQAVFQADGNVAICFNMRGRYILCKHYPDPYEVKRLWGSDQHKELIDNIDPHNECPRCTYNRYNEVMEQAIIEDNMFWKFP